MGVNEKVSKLLKRTSLRTHLKSTFHSLYSPCQTETVFLLRLSSTSLFGRCSLRDDSMCVLDQMHVEICAGSADQVHLEWRHTIPDLFGRAMTVRRMLGASKSHHTCGFHQKLFCCYQNSLFFKVFFNASKFT